MSLRVFDVNSSSLISTDTPLRLLFWCSDYVIEFHCPRVHMLQSVLVSMQRISRVDLSETFSAEQLWFRIISGLFQRCSLPENLWTALIQLWTALKTEIFGDKNQRWNTADLALIFSETAMKSSDFWRIQNDNCGSFFNFWRDFGSTSVLRHIMQICSPICEKKLTTEI